ncbi:MAG: MerR family transcriptional regulator [Actinomycetota bacterium]|nr:MerR family transcriptional regulator [Actinomycetota bacterium]
MSTVTTQRREREEADPGLRTIGVVCEELRDAFPDISVSKIRYLEDQGLIAPKRTRGGYRLFSPEDISRLTTILSLQRDEFLPLRVIREALDGPGASPDRPRRRNIRLTEHEDEIDGAELCERASVAPEFVKELEEYGVVLSRVEAGERLYAESEADIAAACSRLSRFGIDARHLRTFLTATSRQAALVEQLVAPGLRSRNLERRKGALDDLEALARVAQELSHLLFLRDLRGAVERSS